MRVLPLQNSIRRVQVILTSMFLRAVIFLLVPNSTFLLNIDDIPFDWNFVFTFVALFIIATVASVPVFIWGQDKAWLRSIARMSISFGVAILLWDSLAYLLADAELQTLWWLILEVAVLLAVIFLVCWIRFSKMTRIFSAISAVSDSRLPRSL